MLTASKAAGVLITRLIDLRDREAMLVKFEECARARGATQIGGNHVLEVVLRERYYVKLADGLQGGPGWGPTDPTADTEVERQILLHGTEQDWREYAVSVLR